MSHISQSSLYLTPPESAAINVDEANTVNVVAGTRVITSGVPTASAFMTFTPTGSSDVQFLKEGWDYTQAAGVWTMRSAFTVPGVVHLGGCHAPAFVVPNCNGGILTNNNAATIYWRKGTANILGLTIAKPGDSGGDDVQGTPLYTNGQIAFSATDWPPGSEIHLLGTAADQKVTVQFNTPN